MLLALFDYRIQLKTADWAPGKDTCVSQWIHPSHHDDQFIHIPHRKRLQIYAVAKSCSCAWPPPSLYRPFHFLFYFLYLTSSFAVGIITAVNRGHRWERNVDVSCDKLLSQSYMEFFFWWGQVEKNNGSIMQFWTASVGVHCVVLFKRWAAFSNQ